MTVNVFWYTAMRTRCITTLDANPLIEYTLLIE
jgi:hypothetical protein